MEFFKESSDSFYGNRLDGISDVRINEDTLDQIVKEMEETGNVEKADYRLEGKLLNFIVGVNSGLDAAVAKSMGDLILRQLTKEQLGYYDIQFYLLETTSGENSVYPMIGYKHKTSDSFVW